MTPGREAVRRLLTGKDPERVALKDNPRGDTLAEWLRQGYPTATVFRRKGETLFRPLRPRTR